MQALQASCVLLPFCMVSGTCRFATVIRMASSRASEPPFMVLQPVDGALLQWYGSDNLMCCRGGLLASQHQPLSHTGVPVFQLRYDPRAALSMGCTEGSDPGSSMQARSRAAGSAGVPCRSFRWPPVLLAVA